MPLALIQNAEATRGPQQEYTDYRVMSGQLQIGRIYQRETAVRPEMRWLWAINGVIAGKDVMRHAGMTATFEEAQAELNENWRKWLAWANLQEASIVPPLVPPNSPPV
jgi:hypothetical protein